jgi:hypothetical protein
LNNSFLSAVQNYGEEKWRGRGEMMNDGKDK